MNVNTTFRDATATYDDGVLTVSNSVYKRTWKWTGKGLVTTQLSSVQTGKVWTREQSALDCDWLLPGYDNSHDAELTSVTANVCDDEGFTSEHIEVVAEVAYPAPKVLLRYTVWVYPDAPGIRTQVSVKAMDGYSADAANAAIQSHHQLDFIPVNFEGLRRRMLGYYNETQQRNDTCEDILKEEMLAHPFRNREYHTWPSVVCLENQEEGIALVKESHKCPNQIGYDCGLFALDARSGLSSRGWGLMQKEIDSTWRSAWASWNFVYAGGDRGRETAFKAFDSARYPLDTERDVYVQANTWGSGDGAGGSGSRYAAVEEEVLKELESCADLGIDILQIDDGWQTPPCARTWKTEETGGWYPHPETHPNGWGPVKEKAAELGVKLGLWAAAMPVTLEELQDNFRDGGFLTYKLDFASLRNNEEIRALMEKVRAFIKSTDHKVRVNWDVTEVSRRYGYFFAREVGCLYLANRKPVHPPSTNYRPHTMLRDLWQLSKYINVRKIQGSIQNIDRVNPRMSDADLHTHDYSVAVALMSTPLFFQQTLFYDEAARKQIRPLLSAYKEHQKAIFEATTYPIGSKPDNYSWSGFQNHDAKTGTGYLMIYRELNNDDPTATINLEFVAGKALTITNLMDKTQRAVTVGENGEVEFTCAHTPGYLFLKYES